MLTEDRRASGLRSGLLPGTTFPQLKDKIQPAPQDLQLTPYSFEGPTVNGNGTTVTLYEPRQLIDAPILNPLRKLINDAFRESHVRHDIMPGGIDRLQSEVQFLENMGSDPGTFSYIMTEVKSGKLIATAGAHRYIAPVFQTNHEGEAVTFQRVRIPPGSEAAELWELKLMAVRPDLRGIGLAKYLMALVDEEVKRRVRADVTAALNGATKARRLFMLITTVKEANETFYLRRGYQHDYETKHGKGHYGSATGFSVVHMSKELSC